MRCSSSLISCRANKSLDSSLQRLEKRNLGENTQHSHESAFSVSISACRFQRALYQSSALSLRSGDLYWRSNLADSTPCCMSIWTMDASSTCTMALPVEVCELKPTMRLLRSVRILRAQQQTRLMRNQMNDRQSTARGHNTPALQLLTSEQRRHNNTSDSSSIAPTAYSSFARCSRTEED